MKYLGLWSPGLQKSFWKICKTLQPSFYILNVRSLMLLCDQYCKRSLTIGRVTQWRNQRKTVSLKFTVVSNFNFAFYYPKILKSCLTYHICMKVYFRGVTSHVIIAVKLFNTWHTLQWSLSLFVIPDPLCNKNCWVKLKDHHQQTHATLQSRGQVITWQMKKRYISTSTRSITTKLDREVASDESMLFAKPHNLFFTWIYQVTWQIKKVISPILQDLQPTNLTR